MAAIMLVDDDAGLRRVLVRHLTQRGHTVREAVDGRKAFEQLERALPDLLLTDLVMPEHEGIELIAKVRRRWPGLAIIAMSGGGSVNPPARYLAIAEALGAQCVLTKPFSLAQLDEAIDEHGPSARDPH